eukprot:COSAG06_NODE_39820_length_408_cov_1.000000_1_plen_42_part_10
MCVARTATNSLSSVFLPKQAANRHVVSAIDTHEYCQWRENEA